MGSGFRRFACPTRWNNAVKFIVKQLIIVNKLIVKQLIIVNKLIIYQFIVKQQHGITPEDNPKLCFLDSPRRASLIEPQTALERRMPCTLYADR